MLSGWFCAPKAKETTGGALEAEVGIVSIATDVEAKANTTGLKADRTSVVHAGQLPTVDATEVQVINDFNGVALTIAADATATRNNFLARLSDSFVTLLNDLKASVLTNITNISTNATNITNNTTNITELNTSVYGPGGTSTTPTGPSLLTTVYGPSGDPDSPDGGLLEDGALIVEKDDLNPITTKTINFEYQALSAIEIDSINFNLTKLTPGLTTEIIGDEDTSTDDKITISNIGNTDLSLGISGTDLISQTKIPFNHLQIRQHTVYGLNIRLGNQA